MMNYMGLMMIKMADDTTINNPENYRGFKQEKIGMNDVIIRHVNKVLGLTTKEFRGGYYDENIIQVGGQLLIKKVYIEDGRAAYCNAVESLHALINYNVLKMGGPDLIKESDIVKGGIDKLKKDYLEKVEGTENPKKARYKYVSNKLILSKRLFKELLVVMAQLDMEEDEDEE